MASEKCRLGQYDVAIKLCERAESAYETLELEVLGLNIAATRLLEQVESTYQTHELAELGLALSNNPACDLVMISIALNRALRSLLVDTSCTSSVPYLYDEGVKRGVITKRAQDTHWFWRIRDEVVHPSINSACGADLIREATELGVQLLRTVDPCCEQKTVSREEGRVVVLCSLIERDLKEQILQKRVGIPPGPQPLEYLYELARGKEKWNHETIQSLATYWSYRKEIVHEDVEDYSFPPEDMSSEVYKGLQLLVRIRSGL